MNIFGDENPYRVIVRATTTFNGKRYRVQCAADELAWNDPIVREVTRDRLKQAIAESIMKEIEIEFEARHEGLRVYRPPQP